jgi:NTE family protein
VLRFPGRILSLLWPGSGRVAGEPPERLHGLLDSAGIERVVREAIPWSAIARNLAEGRVRVLCVAATQVATGRVVAFVQGGEIEEPLWAHDPTVVPRRASLEPAHALASAAIPVIFPAVRLDGTYYVDGGLRLNTPLAPAIHLGANRLLVIALRHGIPRGEAAAAAERSIDSDASSLAVYGKVLNALLLDHVDTDVGRLRLVNAILRSGADAFGPPFLGALNEAARVRGWRHGFRVVDDLVLRPSQDPGRLASEVLRAKRASGGLPIRVRLLLDALAAIGAPLESDLLSYLFFDADYADALIDLGFRDAQRREQDLARFLFDPA